MRGFKRVDAALIGAMAALVAACAEGAPENSLAAAGDDPAARAQAVLSLPSRPVEDHADDELRKPANVLAFIDVRPGMKVFEMEAGAGYYTELLSPLVGPQGEVVMHNPESFDAFLGDIVPKRVEGLDNVRVSKSNFDDLDADNASMDMVTWMLGPHDLYYEPGGVSLGDDKQAFAEIMRILKPGGVFIVIDHAATPGSPRSAGGVVHRIDPALVREMAAEAGFVLAGESDVLRHPEDNYDANIFEPEVRRKTDRFLYKFKKPE
ncbi:class I SAM-dependent methyltransferase [Hyphococcus sp.]|jgi:predicted methyltransferase|uniref:class I SAM-dependent methyltransferase n=1 Tax=Hyphococcus sp. TaxID=2038636 RepID=UPI003D0BD931